MQLLKLEGRTLWAPAVGVLIFQQAIVGCTLTTVIIPTMHRLIVTERLFQAIVLSLGNHYCWSTV